MTLVLAHIISDCQTNQSLNVLAHQRISDRAVIEASLQSFKAIREMREDALEPRCASLLRDMLDVEADAAKYRAQVLKAGSTQGLRTSKVLEIRIPYIGVIRISGEAVEIDKSNPNQGNPDELHQNGVNIGGIGSMHVKDREPEKAMDAAIMAYNNSALGLHIDFAEQHQTYPEPGISMDEWMNQPTDTAFFDALMRGSNDHVLGPEPWRF